MDPNEVWALTVFSLLALLDEIPARILFAAASTASTEDESRDC